MFLTSPRLYHCRCQAHKTATFRPLTALLTASTTPDLRFLETKWAGRCTIAGMEVLHAIRKGQVRMPEHAPQTPAEQCYALAA